MFVEDLWRNRFVYVPKTRTMTFQNRTSKRISKFLVIVGSLTPRAPQHQGGHSVESSESRHGHRSCTTAGKLTDKDARVECESQVHTQVWLQSPLVTLLKHGWLFLISVPSMMQVWAPECMYLSRSTAVHMSVQTAVSFLDMDQPPARFLIMPLSHSLPLTYPKMKSVAFICLAVAGLARAYPNIHQHLEERNTHSDSSWGGLLPLTTPKFDAEAQYVDTTGEHAWKAPGETDQRGPCPGLNALANHGYLPHNGIGTVDQFIDATTKGE